MNIKYNTADQAKKFLLSRSSKTLKNVADVINSIETEVIAPNQSVYIVSAPEGKKVLPFFNVVLALKKHEVEKIYALYPDCDEVMAKMPDSVRSSFYEKLKSKVR